MASQLPNEVHENAPFQVPDIPDSEAYFGEAPEDREHAPKHNAPCKPDPNQEEQVTGSNE